MVRRWELSAYSTYVQLSLVAAGRELWSQHSLHMLIIAAWRPVQASSLRPTHSSWSAGLSSHGGIIRIWSACFLRILADATPCAELWTGESTFRQPTGKRAAFLTPPLQHSGQATGTLAHVWTGGPNMNYLLVHKHLVKWNCPVMLEGFVKPHQSVVFLAMLLYTAIDTLFLLKTWCMNRKPHVELHW